MNYHLAPPLMTGVLKEVVGLLQVPSTEIADAIGMQPLLLADSLDGNRPASIEEYNRIVGYLENYRVHLERLPEEMEPDAAGGNLKLVSAASNTPAVGWKSADDVVELRDRIDRMRLNVSAMARGIGLTRTQLYGSLVGTRRLGSDEYEKISAYIESILGHPTRVRSVTSFRKSASPSPALKSPADVLRLKQQLQRRSITVSQIARATGLDRMRLHNGFRATRKLSTKDFDQIVAYLTALDDVTFLPAIPLRSAVRQNQVPVTASKSPPSLVAAPAPSLPQTQDQDGKIAIYRAATPMSADCFYSERIIGEFRATPPGLAHVPGTYGMFVAGTELEPKYSSGEVIFLNPNQPPALGKWVLAWLSEKRFVVGQVTKMNPASFQISRSGMKVQRTIDLSMDVATIAGSWCS